VVGDWIQEYKAGKEMATISLAQFFVYCCGSKTVVDKGLVLASKYPDVVRVMTEEYDEVYKHIVQCRFHTKYMSKFDRKLAIIQS